jgi:hypothetical protein
VWALAEDLDRRSIRSKSRHLVCGCIIECLQLTGTAATDG